MFLSSQTLAFEIVAPGHFHNSGTCVPHSFAACGTVLACNVFCYSCSAMLVCMPKNLVSWLQHGLFVFGKGLRQFAWFGRLITHMEKHCPPPVSLRPLKLKCNAKRILKVCMLVLSWLSRTALGNYLGRFLAVLEPKIEATKI